LTADGRPAPAAGTRWRIWLATITGLVLVGWLGGAATEIGPWYRALAKPSWQPPDAAFGPAWTTIYVCAAWAIVRTWQRADGPLRRRFLLACGINAVLNVMWSVLFFTLRRPDWALAQVPLLWLSILWLVLLARRVDRRSALLLLPYLGWVAFAAVLNAAVVRLNAPFG
jgi:translocator protein